MRKIGPANMKIRAIANLYAMSLTFFPSTIRLNLKKRAFRYANGIKAIQTAKKRAK
jgi:hypothetical protein